MATSDLTAVFDRDAEGSRPVALTLLSGALAALFLSPLVWVVANALDADGALELLTAPTTVEVFVNSGFLVAGVTLGSLVVGVPAAYLTVRTDMPFKRPLTVLLAMPLVIPSYIGAFAFVSAFGPRGTVQDFLVPLGVESLPSIYGLAGTVLVLTLYTYPYVFLTTRAALKSMDTTLVDAARTLGLGRREAFRRVTLPQIRPAIAAGALLVALYALSDFGTPSVMRYSVFTSVIYSVYGDVLGGGRDLAAMLSLQLVVVTTVILAIESRVRGSGVTAESPNARATPLRLGRWRYVAVGACLFVAALAMAVPLGVLTNWLLVAGSPTNSALAFEFGYVTNSVAVAAAAALFAGLAALPIAYLAARSDRTLPSLFERASYVGYAVPGVVMGLALVYFGARYGGDLYRNGLILLPLLVFAYVVRFLPQAVGSSRASVEQVSGRLPEAARTLGRSPTEAFRDVTLPLVAPGVAAGAALVFLTTMKELPATLMLRPAGFDTLVTRVWTAYESGYVGQAALPAFVLLFVSALSMLLILRMEGYDVE
ncbi:ABC transporter permease [Halosegnis marinus]|uniref:ABC transporter permease n=1 Tax=Halosegnis marinus TaxID=3034023 RepID=A0ABD5ZSV2_9EURY|nr:iron ABC transporter permease [Halosegnis sp. DT85]